MEKKLSIKENINFLLTELKENYTNRRHYENVRLTLLTFVFTFYSAIGTIIYFLFKDFNLSEKEHKCLEHPFLYLSIALFVIWILGILIYRIFLRNRISFVRATRQVNSIRNALLKESILEYENIYHRLTSKEPKMWVWNGAGIFLIYFIITVNSIIFGSFLTLFLVSINTIPESISLWHIILGPVFTITHGLFWFFCRLKKTLKKAEKELK